MLESTLSRFNSTEGAQKYAAKFESRWEERIRDNNEQRLVASLISIIPPADLQGSVLDIPTGIGRFYPALRNCAPQVVQADWSHPMLEIARSSNDATALGYVRALATELPFASEQFDLVLSVRLCHHLPTPKERARYIAEILRVSRKWVILTYLDKNSLHNVVRSTARRLEGRQLKWTMTTDEVAQTASSQGFEMMNSMLLSRLFSGQRYAVLMRTRAHESRPAEVEPMARPFEIGEPRPIAAAARQLKEPEEEVAPQSDDKYRWVFKRRGLLLAPMMIFCLFSTVGDIERDRVVLPLGLAVFVLGALIRFWSQLHLHLRLRLHKVLTTTGPYAWVRNPIYLGNMAILIGLAIFSEVVYFVPAVALWAALVYSLAVRHEEAHLMRKYGQEYLDYMNRVPRWLPRVPATRWTADVRPYCMVSLRAEQYTLLMLLPYVLLELLTT